MKSVLVIQVAQSELFLQTLLHTATLLSSPINSCITLPPPSFRSHVLHSCSKPVGEHYE